MEVVQDKRTYQSLSLPHPFKYASTIAVDEHQDRF